MTNIRQYITLETISDKYDIREIIYRHLKSMQWQLEEYMATNCPESLQEPIPTDTTGEPVSYEISALLKLMDVQLCAWRRPQNEEIVFYVSKKGRWIARVPPALIAGGDLSSWQVHLSQVVATHYVAESLTPGSS